MKILKQLSNFFFIFYFCYPISTLKANEPVDIWNIEKKEIPNDQSITENKNEDNVNVIQGIKINQSNEQILINESFDISEVNLAGLYDPEENGLSIDMWSNSNGEDIKKTLKNLTSKDLSKFSEKVLDIALLTNSYIPNANISAIEFLDFKFDHLIRKENFDLIKEFLIKNPNLIESEKLIRFYVDYYLKNSQIDKSCEIFEITKEIISDYLTNFKMYCLIHQERVDEAQLLFDLKSEFGDLEKFFANKFNILMGYKKPNEELSDKNVLYFHLSHKTIKDFEYEPKLDTPKFIWNYLSSSNLLKNTDFIDIENAEQIKLVEIATNDEVYEEQELFNLYMRFQFDINQLLNFRNSYKLLEDYEARALLYQRLLLTNESSQKLNLLSLIKKSFDQSNLPNAFDEKLASFLKNIPEEEIPSNYTTFYMKNKEPEKIAELKIKFNNKILHQSKLLNYFQNKTSLPQVEKDTNDLLKKIKKNKKYVFSLKDIIVVESLKSDGVQILRKYQSLYDYKNNLPLGINNLIINGETGLVLLKISEIIGEDDIEDIGIESIDYIVNILNELKLVELRNEILLKVLPLKV